MTFPYPTLPAERIDIFEALRLQREGACLLDLREAAEWAAGSPCGALRVARSRFAEELGGALPDRLQPVLLLCATSVRSTAARAELEARGYRALAVVEGGFRAWAAAALPVEIPDDPDAAWRRRYARQIVLPELGEAGQRRLREARVLLVGAGGLGCPVALYLAAAGVGRLLLVDDDRVEESNLQRQVLHSTAAVGQLKVDSAAARLFALNPDCRIDTLPQRLNASRVDALVADCDVIVDGSDNLPTRYLLSDASLRHGKPLVYGAVERFVGQVSVFHPGSARGQAPCYRCLFPHPPRPEDAPNCAAIGVLGVVPGVIGMLQATEAIKLLLRIGEPLIGSLLIVDLLTQQTRRLGLQADPDCSHCAPGRPFPGYVDYERFCGAS